MLVPILLCEVQEGAWDREGIVQRDEALFEIKGGGGGGIWVWGAAGGARGTGGGGGQDGCSGG